MKLKECMDLRVRRVANGFVVTSCEEMRTGGLATDYVASTEEDLWEVLDEVIRPVVADR